MTKQEKLEKIIKFAVERGWKYADGAKFAVDKVAWGWDITIFNDEGMVTRELYTIIFSHDFAKAVFGKNYWVPHLKQAVISKDPIDCYYKYAE